MSASEVKVLLTAKDKTGTAFKSATSNVQKMKDSYKKVAVAGGVAFAVIGAGLFKVTEDAVKANETFNKFNVTFGDIRDEADKVADNFVNNFGLAKSSAEDLLSSTGDMLTGFGLTGKSALDLSNKTNKLAVDLASFTNKQGGAKRASEALTKALLGERESLKEYGIAILDSDVNTRIAEKGLDNLTGAALRQAKAQVTLEIAYEQSKNAVGDYARTSDSAANLQRTLAERFKGLREEIGNLFIPVLQKFLEKLVPIVKSIRDWVKANPELVRNTIIVTGVVVGLTTAIGILGFAVAGLSIAFGALGISMSALFGPIGLLIAGLTALSVITVSSAQKSERLGNGFYKTKTDAEQLVDTFGSLKNSTSEMSGELKKLGDDASASRKKINDLRDDLLKTTKDFVKQNNESNLTLAEEFVNQEKHIADLKKDIEKEVSDSKTRTATDGNNERLTNLQDQLAKEEEAYNRLKDSVVVTQEAITEAKRVAGLTEFEKRVEAIEKEKKANLEAFNDKVKLINAEIKENERKNAEILASERQLTKDLKEENKKRLTDFERSMQSMKQLGLNTGIDAFANPNNLTHANSTPVFATGGVVPGNIGTPTPILAHAGETVVPFGKGGGGVSININNPTLLDDTMIDILNKKIAETLRDNFRY